MIRPLHRRVSLHPASILFLLCIGILMTVNSFKAFGASTTLSMNITASPLTDPAVITEPSDQARFITPDISIKGTCPDASYVKLYKNGIFNGSAPCENGKFELTVHLIKGANQISIKIFNFSDQEGPVSGGVTLYYDTPATNSIPSARSAALPTANTSAGQLRIITDYKYAVYKSGQPVKLDLALDGGIAPYAAAINWNDGKITPIARTDTSLFSPEHTYEEKPRIYTYVIKVAVGDSDGNSDYVQLMAVIDGMKQDNRTGKTTLATPGSINPNGLRTLLMYMWPAYLIVVLMVLSFYLGEREERRILLRKNFKNSG